MKNQTLEKILKNGWADCVAPKFWNGKFSKPIKRKFKISLCTTVMNRLENVRKTLPKNINDNLDYYPNVEFVLLDYNSSDGLGKWIRSRMMEYIDSGILTYVRTEEPTTYSMTHSRNIAFKVASGDIVNNVDADNFTNEGFASYLNKLANQMPSKAIFAKGRRMLRGRLGFYKKDFVDLLGGYNEDIIGYGHDDHDILHRAWGLGFTMLWFGGKYYNAVEGHKKHQMENYSKYLKNWRYTEKRNKMISFYNLAIGNFKANHGQHWGKATLKKNFESILLI